MSRILACTRSLALQIKNQGEWDDRLPRSFEITTERFQRAQREIGNPSLPDGDNSGKEAEVGEALEEEGEVVGTEVGVKEGMEGGAFGL